VSPGSVSPQAGEPAGFGPGVTGPPGGQPTPEQTAPTAPQQQQMAPAPYPPGASPGWGPGSSSSRPAGPPPDFSSWYDPSPRSGAAAPPGSGTAPWSGAPPEDGPTRRQRSGLWWKVLIIVLAVVGAAAGATAVILLQRHDAGGTPGQTSTSSPGSSPLAIIDAINMPATGALPAGYTTYSQPAAANEKAGFSVAAPTEWKASTSGDPYQTYLTDPADQNVNLLVDLTPHTFPDNMLREALYIENHSLSANRFPGYQRLYLGRLTIRGQPGAYWKFKWDKAGVEQEAIDLLYVAPTSAGSQSYALYMTAPASTWSQLQPVFDEMMETWNPMT
jgi:hypothetical protein